MNFLVFEQAFWMSLCTDLANLPCRPLLKKAVLAVNTKRSEADKECAGTFTAKFVPSLYIACQGSQDRFIAFVDVILCEACLAAPIGL